jgi:hypothetical protein
MILLLYSCDVIFYCVCSAYASLVIILLFFLRTVKAKVWHQLRKKGEKIHEGLSLSSLSMRSYLYKYLSRRRKNKRRCDIVSAQSWRRLEIVPWVFCVVPGSYWCAPRGQACCSTQAQAVVVNGVRRANRILYKYNKRYEVIISISIFIFAVISLILVGTCTVSYTIHNMHLLVDIFVHIFWNVGTKVEILLIWYLSKLRFDNYTTSEPMIWKL